MNENLIQRIHRISNTHGNVSALLTKDSDGVYQRTSYQQLMDIIIKTSHFLIHRCKVKPKDHIGFICDNRAEWIILDLAIQSIPAADVPRGTDTNVEEIAFILEHSDSIGCIFENFEIFNTLIEKHPKALKQCQFILFVESNNVPKKHAKFPKIVHTFEDIQEYSISDEDKKAITSRIAQGSPDDLATIIYTSGTTSLPKGVCLTQRAFEVQINSIVPDKIPFKPGDVLLSILPVWHSYAREVQYILLGVAGTIAYSVPIGKILLEDLKKSKAQYMTSVPRIWESVYTSIQRKIRQSSPIRRGIFQCALSIGKLHSITKHMIQGTMPTYKPRSKSLDFIIGILPYCILFPLRFLFDLLVFKKIRKLLGPHFTAGISGGGALPPHVDIFFEAANIKILEGYGLTETAPILSVRTEKKPEKNSVGSPLSSVTIKVINEQGKVCKPGEVGILYVKTAQVMQGYYKSEELTKQILSEDGWLNTGDLVMYSRDNCIKIMGRAKDTIVLLSGENVEPEHVENTLLRSDFIEQAFVAGQDKKVISALIVPNTEELLQYAKDNGLPENIKSLCANKEVQLIYEHEIQEVSQNLLPFEKVNKFALIPHPFAVGAELTQTLKMKRTVIAEKYKDIIESCYT